MRVTGKSGRSSKRRLRIEKLDARELLAVDFAAGLCFPEPAESHGVLDTSEFGELHIEHAHEGGDDDLLRFDSDGNAYYFDPEPDGLKGSEKDGYDGPTNSAVGKFALNVPPYSSFPSASQKIFLDFDGHDVQNSVWNNRDYGHGNTGSLIRAVAYSTDDDLENFNSTELTRIREIWARVAEDFRPFDVDVTTIEPPLSQFTAGGEAIRVLISTNINALNNQQWYNNAGGVAYLNSWNWTSDTPVWVFENRLSNGNEKYVAEAASHEVGHAFNLRHDGVSGGAAYYTGHGSGAEGWAPIMGVGYYQPLVQWSKAEYPNANRTNEDDTARIASMVDYRSDDHGDDAGSATVLDIGAGGVIAADGEIHKADDLDAFEFVTRAGDVSLSVTPFETGDGKANLNVGLQLFNSEGGLVAEADQLDQLHGTLDVNLPDGFFTLIVDGVGRAADGSDYGFSDYGSLGSYSLAGTVIENTPPVAFNDEANVVSGTEVTIDAIVNDTDADGDDLLIIDVGSASNGTTAIVDNKIVYTSDEGALGADSFEYTISDGFGGTDTGVVNVEAVPLLSVDSLVIGDGTDQRSKVTQIQVGFSTVVVIDDDAILVEKRGDQGGPVEIALNTEVIGGKSLTTITFAGSFAEAYGSLVNGNYMLSIFGSLVTDLYGFELDGDGDNASGGDFVLGDAAVDRLFRFKGDFNGDRNVDVPDFLDFRSAFGSSSEDDEYFAPADFDDDDDIDVEDFLVFRTEFGSTLDFE